MKPNLNDSHKAFPALGQGIYANTAAFGPMPKRLYDWRSEYEKGLLTYGSSYYEIGLKAISDSRTYLAKFFNNSVRQVTLVPNFSLGINMVLNAFHPKLKVLLIEEDYPSINWPFEKRRFDITKIKLGHSLEERIREEIKKNNINLLAVSLVQWLSGSRISLDFIKKLKAENPSLTIMVDGTQFCGMFPFSFHDSGIDILISSGYKWMLSGYGNAFMLFSEEFITANAPQIIGFGSADGYLERKEKIPFYKYFEPGHLDPLAMGSLAISIQSLMDFGMQAIGEKNLNISNYAKNQFEQLALLPNWICERTQHSTIFNIAASKQTFNMLTQKGVICSARGNGIRLSFNFFNQKDDIDQIVRALKNARDK